MIDYLELDQISSKLLIYFNKFYITWVIIDKEP
jgi:hypothetical protein